MSMIGITRKMRSLLSLNRDREVAAIKRLLVLSPSDSLLDVGAGDGYWTHKFTLKCRKVVGLEPDLELLTLARAIHSSVQLDYVRGTAEQIPMESDVFDKVASVSCLEHFGNPLQGLMEMARVLKPGGRLAISVDSLLPENSPASFREWHAKRHYVTKYFRLDELINMVQAVGLIYESENTMHLFRSRHAAQLRQIFIRSPRLLLPFFPVFYYLIRLLDSMQDHMHGQILIISARKPTHIT